MMPISFSLGRPNTLAAAPPAYLSWRGTALAEKTMQTLVITALVILYSDSSVPRANCEDILGKSELHILAGITGREQLPPRHLRWCI